MRTINLSLLLLIICSLMMACQQGQSDTEKTTASKNKVTVESNTSTNTSEVKETQKVSDKPVRRMSIDSIRNVAKKKELKTSIKDKNSPIINADSAARLRNKIREARAESTAKAETSIADKTGKKTTKAETSIADKTRKTTKARTPYSEKTLKPHTKLLSVWNCKCKELENTQGKSDEAIKCRNNHKEKLKAFENGYATADMKDQFSESYQQAVKKSCP